MKEEEKKEEGGKGEALTYIMIGKHEGRMGEKKTGIIANKD